MTITIRPMWAVLAVALLGVLVGMAISQVAFAGAGTNPTAEASRSGVYPVLAKLQAIDAELGPYGAPSIEPILINIEEDTNAACAVIQEHPLGTCHTGP